jgi:hypothetical protein
MSIYLIKDVAIINTFKQSMHNIWVARCTETIAWEKTQKINKKEKIQKDKWTPNNKKNTNIKDFEKQTNKILTQVLEHKIETFKTFNFIFRYISLDNENTDAA